MKDSNVSSQHGIGRFFLNCDKWEPSPTEWQLALSLLSVEAVTKCNRFKSEKDRKLAVISRLLQRFAVHEMLNVDYDDINIVRTKFGKPVIDFEPEVLRQAIKSKCFDNFNINASHHGSLVAVSTEPLMAVGVDVVDEKEKKKIHTSIASVCSSVGNSLTPSEMRYIKYGDSKDVCLGFDACLARFYRIWALKESYVKAHGLGLRLDISTISFFQLREGDNNEWGVLLNNVEPMPRWSFHAQKVDEKHVVCIARAPPQHCDLDFRRLLPQSKISPEKCAEAISQPQPLFTEVFFHSIIPKNLQQQVYDIRAGLGRYKVATEVVM